MKKIMLLLLTLLVLMFSSVHVSAMIKIGFIASVTGPASFLGDPEKKTAVMIQDWLNSSGGINGVPVEILIEDSKSLETDALLATKKLIEKDNVVVLVGSSTTGESLAMAPICEKAGVPMISMASALAIVTPGDEMKRMESSDKPWLEVPKKQRSWIFKTGQNDSSAVERAFIYCHAKNIKKIGILTVSTAVGIEGRKQLKRLAPKYGIEIVVDEVYGPKDSDMTAQLTRIRGLSPQAIINWSIGAPQIIVTKNWNDLGMRNIPLIQGHGFGNKNNIRLAGNAAEGVLVPLVGLVYADKLSPKALNKQVVMKYKTEFEKRYQQDVSTFGGAAHDALMMVVDALKAVGPDKGKIRDYLENNIKNWPGTAGVFNISPLDHTGVGVSAFEMVQVVNGDWDLAK